MADYQLGLIGAGNMAEAILRGVIRSNFVVHNTIVASEASAERRQHITNETQVACVEDNRIPAACPRVVLAVKPTGLFSENLTEKV